jgi:hypothetical protein
MRITKTIISKIRLTTNLKDKNNESLTLCKPNSCFFDNLQKIYRINSAISQNIDKIVIF